MIARPAPRQRDPVLHQAFGRCGELLREETILSLLPSWAGALTDEEELRNADSIAIRRDAGLGDCILLQATWATLKRLLPHLAITFCCPERLIPLFAPDPDLAEVKAYSNQPTGCDIDVDLRDYVERHPLRDKQDRAELFASSIGVTLGPASPTVYLPGLVLMRTVRPTIAIALHGAYPRRSWPLDHIRSLAVMCDEAGWDVLLVGERAEEEGAVGESGSYVCGYPVEVLARILANCDVVVSPDTGVLHLAGALQHYGKARIVGIFGVIEPLLRITRYSYARYLIARQLDCCPCQQGGAYMTCAPHSECPPCMWAVTPEKVFDAVAKTLRPLEWAHSVGKEATGRRATTKAGKNDARIVKMPQKAANRTKEMMPHGPVRDQQGGLAQAPPVFAPNPG